MGSLTLIGTVSPAGGNFLAISGSSHYLLVTIKVERTLALLRQSEVVYQIMQVTGEEWRWRIS